MNQIYLDTARLPMQIAPLVFVGGTFALKDGEEHLVHPDQDPVGVRVGIARQAPDRLEDRRKASATRDGKRLGQRVCGPPGERPKAS